MNRFGRIAVILVFITLLAALRVLNNQSTPAVATSATDAGAASGKAPNSTLSRYGLRLEGVSRSAGIDFVHQAPKLDPKLDHIMPQIASMGASVAVADFDRDGWQDFYTTDSGEGSKNRLYRNLGDGTFRDVAESLAVADVNRPGTGVSMGSIWGDYDNDGYEDMFVYKWDWPELFHNDSGKGFARVTDRAGLSNWVNAGCATWLDYDRDGHLDLFLAGYRDDRLDLWHLKTTKMMPESFEAARDAGPAGPPQREAPATARAGPPPALRPEDRADRPRLEPPRRDRAPGYHLTPIGVFEDTVRRTLSNNLHWQLDVNFSEDECRVCRDHAPGQPERDSADPPWPPQARGHLQERNRDQAYEVHGQWRVPQKVLFTC